MNSQVLYVLFVIAPLCPTPPQPPQDGLVVNNPMIIETSSQEVCAVNSDPMSMKCPSFLSIYIKTASIGRDPALGKILCNRSDGKFYLYIFNRFSQLLLKIYFVLATCPFQLLTIRSQKVYASIHQSQQLQENHAMDRY
jgi:hypothetical protein